MTPTAYSIPQPDESKAVELGTVCWKVQSHVDMKRLNPNVAAARQKRHVFAAAAIKTCRMESMLMDRS